MDVHGQPDVSLAVRLALPLDRQAGAKMAP
jgi:hypothetical protein